MGLPGPDTGQPEQGVTRYRIGQLVDFSLRHLRAMVARMPQIVRVAHQDEAFVGLELAPEHELIRHARPDQFLPFLWVEGDPPKDLMYTPDLGAMRAFAAHHVKQLRLMSTLRERVFREYALLARERRIPPR